MPDIASAKQKINDTEVNADAPLSEALHEKIGGSINYLIDTTDELLTILSNSSYGTVDIDYFAAPNTSSEVTLASMPSIAIPDGGMIIFWINSRRQSGFPNQTSNDGFLVSTFGQAGANGTLSLKRGSTSLLTETIAVSSGGVNHCRGEVTYIDKPSAGTYNYAVTFQYSTALSSSFLTARGTLNYIVVPFS